jgi:hypothetical protein
MPRAKKVNKKQFNKMTEEQQIKELQKITKRANVRLTLLEEKGQTGESYNKVQKFLQNDVRNRFYEGKKYTTEKIKSTFEALSNFMNDVGSTLGGVKKDVVNTIKNTIKQKGSFNITDMEHFTRQEKIYASEFLSSDANKKLNNLEKEGVETPASKQAKYYNDVTGRKKNRFYRGGNFKTDKDLAIHLDNVLAFENSKSATLEGYNETYNKRIETFRDKGVNIPEGKENDFFDFLSSNEFKTLSKYADSDQVIETYVDARNKDVDVKEINNAFQEFLNNDLTFDEVQERLKVAKWQNGGDLLH